MPKNTRRVVVSRNVTFQTTYDVVGYPEETGANLLNVLGGASGSTGQLALGELLAGATLIKNGSIVRSNWTVVGTPINIEGYRIRTPNRIMNPGQRVVSVKPLTGNEAATGKQFVAITAGTTANVVAEPWWNITNGATTVDGTVTLCTLPKFPVITDYVSNTAFALGTVIRPYGNSLKEYLVTVANVASAHTPVWTSVDTVGTTVPFQSGGQLICIAGCITYAINTYYYVGDVVKPTANSSEEYLCLVAGTSGNGALSLGAVGNTGSFGTAQFKRMV